MHARIARHGKEPLTIVPHDPGIVAFFKVDVSTWRIQGFVKRVHIHNMIEVSPPLSGLIGRKCRNRSI